MWYDICVLLNLDFFVQLYFDVFSFYRSLFLKIKVDPLTTILQQLIEGLSWKFNLIDHMREDPGLFKSLFCHSALLEWSYDSCLHSLNCNWSADGSNAKTKELKTYKAFIELCEVSYHDGKFLFYLVASYFIIVYID